MTTRASRILFGAALAVAVTRWTVAAAEGAPFVELVADGRPERFDKACGDAFVEIRITPGFRRVP